MVVGTTFHSQIGNSVLVATGSTVPVAFNNATTKNLSGVSVAVTWTADQHAKCKKTNVRLTRSSLWQRVEQHNRKRNGVKHKKQSGSALHTLTELHCCDSGKHTAKINRTKQLCRSKNIAFCANAISKDIAFCANAILLAMSLDLQQISQEPKI